MKETSASTLLSNKQTSSFSFWEIRTTTSLSLCLLSWLTSLTLSTVQQNKQECFSKWTSSWPQIKSAIFPKTPIHHFSRMSRIEWGALRRTTMINLSALLCSALLCSELWSRWSLKGTFFGVAQCDDSHEGGSHGSLSLSIPSPPTKWVQLQSLSGTIH